MDSIKLRFFFLFFLSFFFYMSYTRMVMRPYSCMYYIVVSATSGSSSRSSAYEHNMRVRDKTLLFVYR